MARTILDPEGYAADLDVFCGEPTSDADTAAEIVRAWYEAHRETWVARHRPNADRRGGVADEFMLRFIDVVRLVTEAKNKAARKS